jgi:thymidylate synthase
MAPEELPIAEPAPKIDAIPSTQNGATKPTATNHSHEEYQYLNLIRDIMDHGEFRPDRYTSPPVANYEI